MKRPALINTRSLVYLFLSVLLLSTVFADSHETEIPPDMEVNNAILELQKNPQVTLERFEQFRTALRTNVQARTTFEAALTAQNSQIGTNPAVVQAWLESRGFTVTANEISRWTINPGNQFDMRNVPFISTITEENGESRRAIVLDLEHPSMANAHFGDEAILLTDDTRVYPGSVEPGATIDATSDTVARIVRSEDHPGLIVASGRVLLVAGTEFAIWANSEGVSIEAGGLEFRKGDRAPFVVTPDQIDGQPIHRVVNGVHRQAVDNQGTQETLAIRFADSIVHRDRRLEVRGEVSVWQNDVEQARLETRNHILFTTAAQCERCLFVSNGQVNGDLTGLTDVRLTPIRTNSIILSTADSLTIDMSAYAPRSEEDPGPEIDLFPANARSTITIVRNGVSVGTITGEGFYRGLPIQEYGVASITINPPERNFFFIINNDGTVEVNSREAQISPENKAILDALRQLTESNIIARGRSINYGSSNEQAVRALQNALIAGGFLQRSIQGRNQLDGVYGTNTEEAVERFQRRVHILDDGLYGINSNERMIQFLERRFTSTRTGAVTLPDPGSLVEWQEASALIRSGDVAVNTVVTIPITIERETEVTPIHTWRFDAEWFRRAQEADGSADTNWDASQLIERFRNGRGFVSTTTTEEAYTLEQIDQYYRERLTQLQAAREQVDRELAADPTARAEILARIDRAIERASQQTENEVDRAVNMYLSEDEVRSALQDAQIIPRDTTTIIPESEVTDAETRRREMWSRIYEMPWTEENEAQVIARAQEAEANAERAYMRTVLQTPPVDINDAFSPYRLTAFAMTSLSSEQLAALGLERDSLPSSMPASRVYEIYQTHLSLFSEYVRSIPSLWTDAAEGETRTIYSDGRPINPFMAALGRNREMPSQQEFPVIGYIAGHPVLDARAYVERGQFPVGTIPSGQIEGVGIHTSTASALSAVNQVADGGYVYPFVVSKEGYIIMLTDVFGQDPSGTRTFARSTATRHTEMNAHFIQVENEGRLQRYFTAGDSLRTSVPEDTLPASQLGANMALFMWLHQNGVPLNARSHHEIESRNNDGTQVRNWYYNQIRQFGSSLVFR